MDTPKGVKPLPDSHVHLAFSLAAIGLEAGVRRWLLLSEKHPRAVSPLTAAYRSGPDSIESELVNLAVAMEYWVAACKKESKKRPAWTKSKGCPAELLAKHVGAEFRDFIGGDEKKWAGLFWDRYNVIKHDPSHPIDHYELFFLARSARVLLMCVLLNRVARTKAPTRWICNSLQFNQVGAEVRTLLASNPKLSRR
ncbi:HEPN domain-containing protein [Prescottella equi]|uniref:HEPN domain-containing protein n=1 Tax=Rhodococcus hoagii TaxID=43767 RepID=UPI000AEB0A28|nr:HEPN domain-containing protein [Prescottella equi]